MCDWILLGFALFPFAATYGQVPELDRLVGKDLWKEPGADLRRLNQMLGEIPKGAMMQPVPWHVWKTSSEGPTRYVVLLGEPPFGVPAGSSASVQLLDTTGKGIGAWSFQTGWRNVFVGASLESSDGLGSDVLVIETAPVINGRDIVREYFSIGNERVRLIRLQDSKNRAVQNEYVFPNFEIGVIPDAQSVEQFARLLESTDKADVLSVLVFLSGRHLAEPRRAFVPESQESKYAALFQEVIGDSRIHTLIERLTTSDDEWIKQAAKLAARGPRERLLQ
jgi:hypothetical protein